MNPADMLTMARLIASNLSTVPSEASPQLRPGYARALNRVVESPARALSLLGAAKLLGLPRCRSHHAGRPYAIEQPVGALGAVNQGLPAERVFWHVREVIGGQIVQTRWRMSLLGLVTAQGQFSRQQALAGDHYFVFRFGPLNCLPGLPPAP
jgi:hypothetical protein